MRSPLLPAFSSLVILLLGLMSGFEAHSQEANRQDASGLVEVPHVKWIKQWPAPGKKKQPRSFRNRFNAIFLGRKIPVLTRPVSVLAYDSANIWVLDQGIRSIFNIQGEVGDIPHFFQKLDHNFPSLVGICSNFPSGFLITDSFENKIYRISPDKKRFENLNDSLKLDHPTGIAWSALTNEIWVVETNAHRITILNERGEIKRQIGSRGTAPGEFNYPTHIWIDKSGLVYVTDAMNFRVQVLRTTGEVVSVFGQPGDASGYFARPKGVASDSHGNIYVADALFHVVQVFNLKGNYLYNLGHQGHGEGEFWMPSGIFIDDNDFVYIADSYNSRIQVFQVVYDRK